MKNLQPLPLKQKYWKQVQAEIQRIFDELIYFPIFKAMGEHPKEIKNSINNPLFDAFSDGRVWIEGNRIQGSFNAKISKELKALGAKYSGKSKSWSVPDRLPPEISLARAAADSRFSKIKGSVLSVLDSIDIDVTDNISSIPDTYIDTIDQMESDFQKSVKSVTIAPKLTMEARNIIASEWGYNLDLYIKSWMDENIRKLRKDIEQNVFEGRRAESMVKHIQKNYGVSRRKAEFLARQETSLLMSKFREERYKDLGVSKYRWSTSKDERVRDDHKVLNGKMFAWDSPPVVDRRTGRRAHAGEDFGCRCLAIPVLGD